MANFAGACVAVEADRIIFNSTEFRISVPRACLQEFMGSDGSRDSDENAVVVGSITLANMARTKWVTGADRIVHLDRTDFLSAKSRPE